MVESYRVVPLGEMIEAVRVLGETWGEDAVRNGQVEVHSEAFEVADEQLRLSLGYAILARKTAIMAVPVIAVLASPGGQGNVNKEYKDGECSLEEHCGAA